MTPPSYQALVERNWGFLSQAAQDDIRHARVLFAGCGLGSNAAVLAARTGFTRFVLFDGDRVEASNLNRQAFRVEHLNRNKAHATATLVREINPQAEVRATPAFLTAEMTEAAVQESDIVVNMVDPGPALTGLFDAAHHQGKPVLFPLNVGFGGLLLAFGPDSPSLNDLVGPDVTGDLFLRILLALAPGLPGYLDQFRWMADEVREKQIPPPQLGIAANQTAALLVGAMARIATGTAVPYVPRIMYSDAWEPSLTLWPSE